MALNYAAIAAAAAQELPKVFKDSVETVGAGEGQYLKSGAPESIVGEISQAAGRQACRVYGSGSVNLSPEQSERYERACRPYLDSIGSGTPPTVATPFQGGQCSGVRYQVNGTFTDRSDGSQCGQTRNWQTGNPLGPIGGVFQRGGFWYFSCGEPSGEIQCLVNGSSPLTVGTEGECLPSQAAGGVNALGVSITSVVRIDGQLDNCGDPPPEVTPPQAPGIPDSGPERFNPRPGLDIPIDITLNPDGTIAVDFGLGDVAVDLFGGDEAGGGGGGGSPFGDGPGAAGEPSDTGSGDPATGEGGESEGEAPEGQVLTGVKVEVLTAPSSRVRYTTEVDRGVVYCYMGGAEGLALEPTGALVRSGQFFPAQKDYFTRWQVKARFGYSVRCTPYYRETDGTTT